MLPSGGMPWARETAITGSRFLGWRIGYALFLSVSSANISEMRIESSMTLTAGSTCLLAESASLRLLAHMLAVLSGGIWRLLARWSPVGAFAACWLTIDMPI